MSCPPTVFARGAMVAMGRSRPRIFRGLLSAGKSASLAGVRILEHSLVFVVFVTRNKKLLVTSASLLVTSALLVVTRTLLGTRNKTTLPVHCAGGLVCSSARQLSHR